VVRFRVPGAPGLSRVYFNTKRAYLARVADDCPGVPGGKGGPGYIVKLKYITVI
jgi:hypothetical protein